jgi:hypothetical protein
MNPELAEMENEEFVNIRRQQIRGLENQKAQLTAKLTEVSNRLTHAVQCLSRCGHRTALVAASDILEFYSLSPDRLHRRQKETLRLNLLGAYPRSKLPSQ